MKTINLKGVIGDNITVTVNTENTNYCIIKFDDSDCNGIKSTDQLPELVNNMGWSYSTKEDLENTEKIYNTEISKKKIWSDTADVDI